MMLTWERGSIDGCYVVDIVGIFKWPMGSNSSDMWHLSRAACGKMILCWYKHGVDHDP